LDLYEWAARAAPGERIIYHRGQLGTLPERFTSAGSRASAEGLVFLAHRRRPDGEGHDYEATRITRGTALRLGLVRRGLGGYVRSARRPHVVGRALA